MCPKKKCHQDDKIPNGLKTQMPGSTGSLCAIDMVIKRSDHSGFVSIVSTNSCLMVQNKCLAYDGYRGLGLGNQLILEDLQNIWLSDPAAS